MKVSVLEKAGSVQLQERPDPVPGAGEVLVRVAAVGVCGSDVHYYRHGRIGSFVVEEPLVLGHEASGTVVALGSGSPAELLGKRVSIEPCFPCRECAFCLGGAYNQCRDIQFFATPPVDGAFAELVVAPHDFVYPVPEEVSDEAAALLEPLSVAVWANRNAGVKPGSHVLVSGAGPVGLLAAKVARVSGATRVTVTDVDQTRLDFAAGYGATDVVNTSSTEVDGDYDVFLDCSGAASAVIAGIVRLRPLGRAVLVGMGADELALPVSTIQRNELTVTGTFRYANTWPTALGLVTSGLVDLDALASSHFGLAEVVAALDAGSTPGHIKAIVHPNR